MSVAWTVAAVVTCVSTAVLACLTIGLLRSVSRLEYHTRSLATRCEAVVHDERLSVNQRVLRRF